MNAAEKKLRNRLLLICGCGALVLVGLAFAQAKGAFSAQTFGLLAIAWWGAMLAFLLPSIRRFQREVRARRQARVEQGLPAESREDLSQKIRSLKRYVVAMAILFPLLLWANSDQPRSSEMVGAAVWLLLIGALVRSLLRRQKELKAMGGANRDGDGESQA